MVAPLYLMLPLWSRPEDGPVRVDDFLTIGACTLLAPGNLPAVSKQREIVIIVYTTHADWDYIDRHPMAAKLRRHARLHPLFFDLDDGESKHNRMNKGHRIMLEAAAIARALAVPIFADSVFADGDLKRLCALATGAPRRMVMVMGFRISHEPFLAAFRPNAPLKTRDLVRLFLRHPHSQMLCWDAENPGYGHDIMGGPIWGVGDHGCVSHSIYWEPALIDFSHPWLHDSTPVEAWTIDGHYSYVNTDGPKTYHAVTDSDEFFHITLARETGPMAYHFEHCPMDGTLVEEMHRARAHRTTDPLRQDLYEVRFRVHADDLNASWKPVEAKVDVALRESRVPRRGTYTLTEYEKPRLLEQLATGAVWYYEGLYYSVPLSLGAIDLENSDQRKLPGVTVHCTVEEAKAAVRSSAASSVAPPIRPQKTWREMIPPVLLGSVGNVNLVKLNGHVYTVPQALGPLDLDLPEDRARPGIIAHQTEDAARQAALGMR